MSLSAEFDSRTDRFAYAVVSLGAAALSYDHARTFFLPFMGHAGATVTPLLLDAVVFWLTTACIRQARRGRPLPMLRIGAYVLLALSVTANALGGATWPERVFMALPAALFGYLSEIRIRLALYEHRAAHGDDRLAVLLWLRHPVRSIRARLWQARQHAPAFDTARAERARLAAARDAVRLAMPGRSREARRARTGVLRELNAGRLAPATAVAASGLMGKADVPELHRAALAAALGSELAPAAPPPGEAEALRTEVGAVRNALRADLRTAGDALRADMNAVRDALRTEIETVRAPGEADALRTEIGAVRAAAESLRPGIDAIRDALRTEIDAVRDALGTEIDAVRGALRTDTETVRAPGEADTFRAEMDAARGALRTGTAVPAPGADDGHAEPSAVDRLALVSELAGQVRDAIGSGERWTPDYDAMMQRTGYRRSWCEKAVRDARTAALDEPGYARAGDPIDPPSAAAA